MAGSAGPDDFPVSSIADYLALEEAFGSHPPAWARVVVLELDRLDDAELVQGALEHARQQYGWVVVGLDNLAQAVAWRKDLLRRKQQLFRILEVVSAVSQTDLVSRERRRELLEARFCRALPAAGHAVTEVQCRDLLALANRVSWDARLAHLRATATRWYLKLIWRMSRQTSIPR
uniref:Uncharacterized protein n=1 Tax=Oryza brachyantha TaxID=4533 RepID=J3N8R5_ORYBR